MAFLIKFIVGSFWDINGTGNATIHKNKGLQRFNIWHHIP